VCVHTHVLWSEPYSDELGYP